MVDNREGWRSARTLNQRSAQEALGGLAGVTLGALPINPAHETPHIELPGYRRPAGRPNERRAINDIATARIICRSKQEALVRDPGGH
jgi:hypothetical protein